MSTMSSVIQFLPQTVAGRVAAGLGLCFLGYCVYFDYKRHRDPDFKKKLKEKRKKAKENSKSGIKLPDPNDAEAMQKFMIQEISQGEECIATGDVENGVEHLANAVKVCTQPPQLLMIFQQTLPPTVFQLLIQKITAAEGEEMTSESSGKATITELEEEGVE